MDFDSSLGVNVSLKQSIYWVEKLITKLVTIINSKVNSTIKIT